MNKFISEVTNEDCMEGMARYPDKYFDLAIVDPPYMEDNKPLKSLGPNRTHFDVSKFIPPKENYFKELKRVSKNQIIWGGNYFTDLLPVSRGWICWDKIQAMDKYSDFELAYTSFDKICNTFRFCNNGGFIVKGIDLKIHPTQKPIKLYKWLLHNYAKQGDKILDTHLGSGSSRIAAYEMGFDFTAFELDTEYYEAQEKRYNAHIAQLKLELI
jgi:site-specific DNA-methyltransferase (adenine-specific)